MPIVVVFECPDAMPLTVQAEGGVRLVDLCDASGAEVPFSCRSATCGTCRVSLLEGANWLEAPDEYELELLDVFGDDPTSRRLACQARLRADATGRLRIQVIPFDD